MCEIKSQNMPELRLKATCSEAQDQNIYGSDLLRFPSITDGLGWQKEIVYVTLGLNSELYWGCFMSAQPSE